ncbi:MAG: hypothetical protein CVU73_09190 [Deltaproteobacteria bacterium HGW-Deltaproteobacteria-8]|jgi:hypothetical protein|nr:MAG: hypothetical protein CVU73_09190 [Deltaproteobacteria bacterium HGW-Deltaproteobacteria-8]
MRYVGIFLVCLSSIAFEIFLVRHFAITSWSEYGYWVISMAMAGYSVSGVVLCLFGSAFQRHAGALFFGLPVAMLLLLSGGYAALGLIPFNPLELQNEVLWPGQLVNIGRYYLALFPFFFASGLYVGLSFLAGQENIPKVYMADLVGAGLGAAALLFCMSLVHPFHVPLFLLPPLTLAALTSLPRTRPPVRAALAGLALLCMAGAGWVVLFHNNAAFSQYKPVAMAMNVEDNRVLKEIRSARGYYQLLSSYLERHDPDLSNNYELLGAGGPPPALGLYRDGERLVSLPRPGAMDLGYLNAALDSLPYLLRPQGRVLLAGGRGGFRPREALELGAAFVDTVESDPVLLAILAAHAPAAPPTSFALRLPLSEAAPDTEAGAEAVAEPQDNASAEAAAGPAADLPPEAAGHDAPTGKATPPRLGSPLVLAAKAEVPYSLVDVSPEFLDQGQANKYLLTSEGVARLFQALSADGLISLPMGIGELPVYALKAVATVRQGLLLAGVAEPAAHILVLRSSFTARILVSRQAFSPRDIATARAFAAERSFDTPYFPGIDPAKVEVYNDLPPVSFETGTTEAARPEGAGDTGTGDPRARDALMDDLAAFLQRGDTSASSFRFFNLAPSTQDRPFFHEIIRLSRIPAALARIELLPRQEIGYLVNVAVLAQAALFALIVFLLPMLRRRGMGGLGHGEVLSGFGYFMCLGLGFLFVEIVLIERFTFFLNDPALAFALVLSAMLIASGLGSAFSSRFVPRPRAGIRLACAVAATLAAFSGLLLPRLLDLALAWPDPAKLALAVGIVAPLGFFMGMPFPLALSTYRGVRSPFIPWAWSVNGALSVVATPLANILAVSCGYSLVFYASLGLYALAGLLAPTRREPGANAPEERPE